MYYTGVGSRKTPQSVLRLMERIAQRLAARGLVLRSGRAPGADQAFEIGCKESHKQIFVPWPGFEAEFARTITEDFLMTSSAEAAFRIAASVHPVWDRLTYGAKQLHARNVHQVLGPNLSEINKSSFVVCWTPDGAETADQCTRNTGGTGTAIKLAHKYKVPVFNLFNAGRLERIAELVV